MAELKKDLCGLKFNHLTVTGFAGQDKWKNGKWLCRCRCGNEVTVIRGSLISGNTKACGKCGLAQERHSITHGATGTREYRVWRQVKQRCTNQKNKRFQHYGGRGITMCDRWQEFANFIADMGACPSGLTLERIDNDGNYEPGNCRWATYVDQNNNNRHNHLIEFENQVLSISQWSRRLGLTYAALRNRIRRGWALEHALQPVT